MKNFKKMTSFVLVMALIASMLSGCSTVSGPKVSEPAPVAQKASVYKAGTYTSTQQGMGGKFDVSVTFSEDAIESIEVGENKETLMVGSKAIEILPKRIIENQSLNMDVVTGATYTSYAVIYGVRDCVEQAEGDLDALLSAPLTVDTYNDLAHETDIIIVGGGLAGITTAISAVQNGGNVILLEAKDYLGGNSVLSTGTFLLGGTTIQENLGIKDNADTFYQWILENSDNAKDPVQSAWVAQHGQELIDWFARMSVNFNKEKVNSTDGSEISRGHALSPNIGTAVTTLVNYMDELGVDVRYSTKVESFIKNEKGEIIGVNATDYYGNPVEYYGKEIVVFVN